MGIAQGASVSATENGYPPLHSVRNLEIAKLLIKNGADVKSVVEKTHASPCLGNSVLHSLFHQGVYYYAPRVLLFLIMNGADVNARNSHEETPLHKLVFGYHDQIDDAIFFKCLNILLLAGANPWLKDHSDRTPLDMAKLFKRKWADKFEFALKDYVADKKLQDLIFALVDAISRERTKIFYHESLSFFSTSHINTKFRIPRSGGIESSESKELSDVEQKELKLPSIAEQLKDICTDDEIPARFICPISHLIMDDPVIIGDGHNYDRASIDMWIKQNQDTCPLDPSKKIGEPIPNNDLRSEIDEFRLKKISEAAEKSRSLKM